MAALIGAAISAVDGMIAGIPEGAGATPARQSHKPFLNALCLRLHSAGLPCRATPTDSTEWGAMGSGAYAVKSIRTELARIFACALEGAFPGLEETPLIAPCNNPEHGDYQCNNAMPIFGKCKGKPGFACKNPRAVADAIVGALPETAMIEGVSLAGPGFINVKLSNVWLSQHLTSALTGGIQAWAPTVAKRVVVDFSSPNVAKEMHVGHLRSTILGDTISRCLDYCGADVLRLNHIGDWGTQFGMLIQHLMDKRSGSGSGGGGGADREEDVADLMAFYREAKQRFDEDEDFKARAREAVTTLQSGDPTYIQAWQRICQASRVEFSKVYDRLHVSLVERGESFYNPMLPDTVAELQEKGVAEESDGAVCVFVEGIEAPLIVQKSDGGFGYASTDMAALKHRLQEEKADWILYVTDVGQAQHFKQVFAAARRVGWLDGSRRVEHMPFGLVLGEDGKRMRTRSGDLVRLVELLDEAKSRCMQQIRERREQAGDPISEQELDEAASAMGYGALKYADLKNARLTNYKFSFDEMLELKGNTAVYLLYAHARIAGIVRKSGKDVMELAQHAKVELGHEKEVELAKHLVKLPEALEDMLDELAPNRVTEYLFQLSDKFNVFYTECKVLGSEAEDSRLLLCEVTAEAMRACFRILGITPLYKI